MDLTILNLKNSKNILALKYSKGQINLKLKIYIFQSHIFIKFKIDFLIFVQNYKMANITINTHNKLISINHGMTNFTLNEFDQILPYLPTSLNTIIYYYTSDHTEDSFRDIIQSRKKYQN